MLMELNYLANPIKHEFIKIQGSKGKKKTTTLEPISFCPGEVTPVALHANPPRQVFLAFQLQKLLE